MSKPFVSVFALGGTIASKSSGGNLVQPELTAAELSELIGAGQGLPALRSESLFQIASGDLRFSSIAQVADRIREALTQGACGVVVTQGTDTLEETAFQLDLLLDADQPIVVTGALRNPTLPGADGGANLSAAVRVACDENARGLGVLVVMNDEIHAARFVRKTHTYKPSAFTSPAAGPLGWVAENRVHIAMRPAHSTPVIAWRAEPPDVPLLTITFSMGERALDDLLRDVPAGLVIAALGAGHVPSWLVEKIGALAAKTPVILASRIGAGEGFRETYGYAGSESDLLKRGCLSAGYLDPCKARILLALLLADGAVPDHIRETFSRY